MTTLAYADTKKLGDWFKRDKRKNGDKFTTLRDGAPKWLQEAIYDAHQGDMPNDWVYEECRAACDAIDDGSVDLKEQDVHEHADSRVDVYTGELAQWYADHCGSGVFSQAESDADDYGADASGKDINERLTLVQYCAIARIASTIADAVVRARVDAAEE